MVFVNIVKGQLKLVVMKKFKLFCVLSCAASVWLFTTPSIEACYVEVDCPEITAIPHCSGISSCSSGGGASPWIECDGLRWYCPNPTVS